MGFPSSIFIDPPNSLACAICHDIFQDAKTLKCGHTFCSECLGNLEHAASRVSSLCCPTCRKKFRPGPANVMPALTIRDVVGGLQIRCKHAVKGNEEENATFRRVRRRQNNGIGIGIAPETASLCHCDWTGTLNEWERHSSETCVLAPITCDKVGCDARDIPRGQMEKHQNSASCMVAVLRFETEQKMQENSVHAHLALFCRKWLQHKPDPLFEFLVYRGEFRRKGRSIHRLLVGIPGPKRTPWEGGLYPITMEWRGGIQMPPLCRFARGFHHTNVYPSGTICLSSINVEEGWHPELTIAEILFNIQQLLAHPNINSPAQSAAYICLTGHPGEYDRLARECAKKHSPGEFMDNFKESFPEEINAERTTRWTLVDDCTLSRNHIFRNNEAAAVKEPPAEPAMEPGTHHTPPLNNESGNLSKCNCSCCAWGASFLWDRKREMRLLFDKF